MFWNKEKAVVASAGPFNWDNCDPGTNGEYALLEILGKNWELCFDIGANRGEYTEKLLEFSPGAKIVSFEPNPAAASNIRSSERVTVETLAVGDIDGELEININNEDDTQSSAYRSNDTTVTTRLPQVSIDSYMKKKKIRHIDFIKIDTEGNEVSALKGLKNAIADQSVDYIQFEYGGTYKDAGIRLADAYDLLSQNYIVCHIQPRGVSPTRYSQETETYRYSNWLAISRNIYKENAK